VSVLLPVYNGVRDVERAVRSIQQQTLGNWELLIQDDGSTDGTLELCKALAASDERISVSANGRNLGLAPTMNRLVSEARGRYSAIQEQDDRSTLNRLALEVEVLESDPEVGLVSGIAAWVDDDDQVISHFPGMLSQGKPFPRDRLEMVRLLYVEQCKVVNAACMFRQSAVASMSPPFDEVAKMSIDWQFFVHLAHKWRVHGIPEVLVHMKRGKQHVHMTRNWALRYAEARRCIRVLYQHYRREESSPIDHRLYRQAMASELALEGRFYGRARGVLLILRAIAYDPASHHAWRAARAIAAHGTKRALLLAGLGRQQTGTKP
jgi:glycosyltransferase involved in cell wall biosynthesis